MIEINNLKINISDILGTKWYKLFCFEKLTVKNLSVLTSVSPYSLIPV